MLNMSVEQPRPVALITGASGGIGQACAEALAASREPWDLALHCNAGTAAAHALAARLHAAHGTRCAVLTASFSTPGQADAEAVRLVRACAESPGPPVALIHAAGPLFEKPIAFTKAEEWDTLFEVHLFAAAALLKEMSRHLRKTERGRVVLIGSLAGEIGLGNGAAYAAAKGALSGLAACFALEAARWKTTVNVIAPGFVDTHMTASQDAAKRAALAATVPLGRYATAPEIASLAAYLCSTDAAFVTGQTLVVDGGASLDHIAAQPAEGTASDAQ
jgi:3-oxoacyl-[acyl-carrier protein] reductase